MGGDKLAQKKNDTLCLFNDVWMMCWTNVSLS